MKLYELSISEDDEHEVYYNSVVSVPAHLKRALKFSKQVKSKMYFNDEKQIITGVAIAVDEPIYRYDPDTGEKFNVIFRKDVVSKIIQKYFRKGYHNNLNLQHDPNSDLKSAYLIESYQVDKERGNTVPEAFKDQQLKDGSWIMSYKIEDPKEWEKAKKMNGFSVEGLFEMIEVKPKKNNKMSLLEKLGFSQKQEKPTLEKFKETAEKFAEAVLDDGTQVVYDGELAEGTALFTEVDGVLTPLPEGSYAMGGDMEGVTVEVDGEGMITSISRPDEQTSEEVAEAMEAMKKDYEEKLKTSAEEFDKLEGEHKELKDKFSDLEERIKNLEEKPNGDPKKKKFQRGKKKDDNKNVIDLIRENARKN